MSVFQITILGCSSATPTSKRNPTSQLVNISDRFYLIDCGEATQIQLRRFRIKFQRINHIFISHLHGDHYLGLMGLLSSLHLLGRTTELHVYCPSGLDEIISVQLKHSATVLNYQIIYHFHDYSGSRQIFEDEKISVTSFPLNHRIPCCGFIFREKPRLRTLHKDKIAEYNIPVEQMTAIKHGADFIAGDGKVISNSELTGGPLPARSYAYCSDTCFDQRVIEQVKRVDLLYHEATFLEELKQRAKDTFHSTALEAGTVARDADVGKLVIGHYSARYKDLEPLLAEARSVFPYTSLAVEGEIFKV